MIRSISGAIVLLLLAVAGWGSADFFLDVPRAVVAAGVLSAPFLLSGEMRGVRQGKERGESTAHFVILALLSTVGIAFLFPFFAGHYFVPLPLSSSWRYAGAFLYLGGYAVRIAATRALKSQFSFFVAIQENHQLITSGIYSSIRHPIYLGSLILVTGMALIFPSWYGFLFLAIYSMLLVRRMRIEEQLLLKHFGSVYEEYRMKSYRLVPHIY